MCTTVNELISCEVFSATNIEDLSNILKSFTKFTRENAKIKIKALHKTSPSKFC